MNELCKILLNIALQRRVSPYAHSFQSQRQHQFDHWHKTVQVNTSTSFPLPVITASSAESAPVGFLREKLWEISGKKTITW